MKHSPLHLFATLAAIVAVLCVATFAAAGPTVPHKESCDGMLTGVLPPPGPPPAVGTMTFAGKGVATHMGKYQIIGGHNFTSDGKVLNGTFRSTAADGSTIAGTYAGTFAPIGGDLVRFNVEVQYVTGTGRLAGVKGSAQVIAVLNTATGKVHYDTAGTWTLP